jgi:hypothetical protein
LDNLTADHATATAHADDPITIGGRTYPREDIPEILGRKLDALPRNVRDTDRVPLGIYHGLRFGIVTHSQFPADVYLEGAINRQSALSRDHQGPRAVLNAVDRLATAYGSECVRVQQDLSIAEAQLRDYQARLGKPFTLEAYLTELTALRDQLKAGLSGTAQQPSEPEGPSVSEVADRIKTLKSAHTIEPAPQRVRQKQSTAEEPVTARIRRRNEASHPSDSAIEHPVASQEIGSSEMVLDASIKVPLTFQDRIALDRRRDKGPGKTL